MRGDNIPLITNHNAMERTATMKIVSPVVGELDVASDRIINFPAGMPGFENCQRFTLLHMESAAPRLFLLQSLDDLDVAFTVTTPDFLGLNYEFPLSDDEVNTLQLERSEDVSVLLIMRRNDEAANNEAPVSANLMAPLVLNTHARRGLQKVIGRVDTEVTLRAVA